MTVIVADPAQRRFGFLSMFGFSCTILTTWEATLPLFTEGFEKYDIVTSLEKYRRLTRWQWGPGWSRLWISDCLGRQSVDIQCHRRIGIDVRILHSIDSPD